MAGFTENALSKKLSDLNSSQQSIQTLSLWLIHHRKHHAAIVKLWLRELQNAEDSRRKLTFMYLANDVIQNSKKKGPEFGKEFGTMLKAAFGNMASASDEKTKNSLHRILQIWEERGVYDKQLIKEFRTALGTSVKDDSPPRKKAKAFRRNTPKSPSLERRISEAEADTDESESKEVDANRVEEADFSEGKELDMDLSPSSAEDAPEIEELIKALSELEQSASSDAVVREKIAKLPSEVSYVTALKNLEDQVAAEVLSAQVDDAISMLTEYNGRLAAEMDNRKKVAVMMTNFIHAQNQMLIQAEKRCEEFSDKLKKILLVRQELKSHLQNLPDLTRLPDVTGGLAPLPSAGDLFNFD